MADEQKQTRIEMLKEIAVPMLHADVLLVIGQLPHPDPDEEGVAVFVAQHPRDRDVMVWVVDTLDQMIGALRDEGEDVPYLAHPPENLINPLDELAPKNADEILAELFKQEEEDDGSPE